MHVDRFYFTFTKNSKKSPFTMRESISGYISSGELKIPAQLSIILDSHINWLICCFYKGKKKTALLAYFCIPLLRCEAPTQNV